MRAVVELSAVTHSYKSDIQLHIINSYAAWLSTNRSWISQWSIWRWICAETDIIGERKFICVSFRIIKHLVQMVMILLTMFHGNASSVPHICLSHTTNSTQHWGHTWRDAGLYIKIYWICKLHLKYSRIKLMCFSIRVISNIHWDDIAYIRPSLGTIIENTRHVVWIHCPLWRPMVSVTACNGASEKPLPEPMLSYFQLDPWKQNSINFD